MDQQGVETSLALGAADEECAAAAPARTVATTCPYCGVGCGVLADVAADGAVSVRGDPDHPANYGRLCSKGSALAETLQLDDRLLHPEIEGARASWDEALDLVAQRFSAAVAEHGPDSVAFYVSGQLLTEDYYVANKLMKGFIGSGNIDTNSRLCMSSSVAGHKRAFGTDTVPGVYDDLEQADLVVLVGSNFAWCHPVLFQRVVAARLKRGLKLVVIDPRRTPTAEQADLHLAIAPDGDIALFNALLSHLSRAAPDRDFVERHTSGFAEALAAASALDAAAVARVTGLAAADVAAFLDLFAVTERVVTVYSQGVNQSVCGVDKVNAIINCHLLTGRIGRPGMGPFSITGQPNAMGGREVGGLANQLAAHLEIDVPAHRDLVARVWGATRMATRAGLKAVDLFRAVADGRIKALWIIATNPVDSLPEANAVREALENCPFVVCSDVIRRTDTTRTADVLLPAAAWGEKDGTVTNSERRITRQRAFLGPPGEAMPDWWIVDQVAEPHGVRLRLRLSLRGAYFPRTRRLVGGRQRRRARLRHRGVQRSQRRRLRRPEARAMARAGRRDAGRAPVLLRRAFLHAGPPRPLRRGRLAGGAKRRSRLSADPQHGPHPGSMAHDDPHGEIRDAVGPPSRTLFGAAPRRRRRGRVERRRARGLRESPWRHGGAGRRSAPNRTAAASSRLCTGPIS